MDNVLIDPLIRAENTDGERLTLALPEVMAGLLNETLVSFPALQPHQRHAWHAFLTQLAAMALHHSGVEKPPLDAPSWQSLLRALTKAWPDDEPWKLVVDDLSKPAFMQPPVPENKLDAFKNIIPTPDGLDVLITAKNHDIKMTRIAHPHADHWILALITLQTMEGFLGAGNYGIARMNGGFASRPAVGTRPGPLPGPHFRRDLDLLRLGRETIHNEHHTLYHPERGFTLLWLEPWDGQSELSLATLDPYFIEVCRRVRLTMGRNGPVANAAPSKAARIHSKDLKGNLGDPWTPIRLDKEGGVSLTINESGFGYQLITDLLLESEGYRPSQAQKMRFGKPADHAEFLARALARGQGKTEGYHERRIPLPPIVRAKLGQPKEMDSLATVARKRVEQAGIVAKKALAPAILTMIQRAPGKLNFKDRRIDTWRHRFDQKVDALFFPSLWQSVQQEADTANATWIELLITIGKDLLLEAEESLIAGGGRHHKIAVVAEQVYRGSLRNQFPDHFTRKSQNTDKETA
ncbi:MAG: type I-E CRISPR-associated protein Cse1/CasA [Magnetococcales bacterium]|nr:type I-E CRISPR-associated protein Cse1/CasA [Magnetococcales bacterium]